MHRYLDPILELLLDGYDARAEEAEAAIADAASASVRGLDGGGEPTSPASPPPSPKSPHHDGRTVIFTERGIEILPVRLRQSTLVALSGGVCAYANVRLGRCVVTMPSLTALLARSVLSSDDDISR